MSTFEFNGDKYEKASRHQKEWGNHLIAQLSLQGNESILDLGCGDGALTKELALLVPHGRVLGVDASAGMIQTAEKHRMDHLDFIQLDMNQMDFQEEFDIIYSNAALHWIKDHSRLLKSAYQALRPGGAIQWNFAGDGTCSHFFEVLRPIMQGEDFATYFHAFEWPWFMPTGPAYEKLAEGIGFSKFFVTEVNADRYFSDKDEMIKWIDQPSIVPFIQCIPDEKKDCFREQVIEAMLQKTLQTDGTCFETFRRINVQAWK